ncbi:hypothetical protein CRG98_042676 [Punica granatum]|uniref:NAC domain-containing protein n=1 Tax=Punica granatum TaxID=22663 RepID=A0A2I0HZ39_PUNGR|nr:hypothetical protein CRG98_042676 [Punica granatum]
MDVPHIPGLDFDPSSIQLLAHYLKQRILDHFHSGDPNYSTNHHLIPDIELYNWDPEELPRQYDKKYRNNNRSKRIVPNAGYWKITSPDKKVKSEDTGEEIGKKKALTFYQGRSSSGITTNRGMHEYYLNPSYLGYNIEDMPFVVCHVFKRNGRRGGDDVESASYANDDSGHPATSESRAPTQEAAPNEWFFFCLRKEKYRNNNRSKRIVPNAGYWKITSSDKKVKSKDTGEEIGKKKALTFYQGRSSSGITTNWGMHEYYLNPSYLGYNIEDMPFVVCHVFKRNGRRGGDDVESASYANDDSGHPATSESRAPTQEAAPNEQLSHDLPDYSVRFSGGAEYHSYTYNERVFDGYGALMIAMYL